MKFTSCLDDAALMCQWQHAFDDSRAQGREQTKTAIMAARLVGGHSALKTFLLAMKLTFVLITFGFLHLSAGGFSQKVTLSAKNWRIDSVFSMVKKQTGYVFFCSQDLIRETGPVSVNARNMELPDFLNQLFQDLPLKYSIRNKTIIVRRKSIDPPSREISLEVTMDVSPDYLGLIIGLVRGRDGKVLTGASVQIKGTSKGTVTNATGSFTIDVNAGQILVISYIGYKKKEILIKPDVDLLNIVLEAYDEDIEGVVINTGMLKKDKASFTGAATVFTGAQLKTIGNRNVLESLRSLDPSFIKVENNLNGSNPNSMPTFEIRGQTTINTNTLNDQFNQDPNQPLFILDGFESTLKAIYDLDMNRVATITILKDAASTALYGSRASNGVVVVETKRPVAGKLMMSYNADLNLQIPDLTSYNMMSAAEVLEFERLQGIVYFGGSTGQWDNENKYQHRLTEVQRGVNTYWLSEPLRTPLSSRHSLQFSGGNNELMMNAGFQYEKVKGIMKGSDRDVVGGNIAVSYKKNKLTINNLLTISSSKGNESPYGDFSLFASAIPYYRKTAEDGTVSRFIDPVYDPFVGNPLYNARLNNISKSNDFQLANNLNLLYDINSRFRIQGGMQVSNGHSTFVQFTPPEHTAFSSAVLTQRGSYADERTDSKTIRGNLMLSYGQVVGSSQFSASLRGDISEVSSERRGFTALGFPYGTDGNPLYAFGYTPFGTPLARTAKGRSAGVVAIFNYAWAQRFMVDAVYRLDGSTVFGTENVFKPFYSAGLGWNIHNEPFFKESKFLNLLKLRTTAGYTGNENIGIFTSVSTYQFKTGNNNTFGQGIVVNTLGNPGLDWQRTLQWSYGLDYSIWDNRISGFIEYFTKLTDPLTIADPNILPSSTAAGANYVTNVGNLNTRGWNFNITVRPINNPSQRIIWTVGFMGNRINSVYGGLEDRLAKLNEAEVKTSGLLRYKDGYSPNDMWAVVSRGIDPATGNEIFQKNDGSLSYFYSTDDIVKVGNSRPLLEGGINTSFTYGNFSFSAVARYRVGGYVYNSALFDKVENIYGVRQNLDKRALSDRWKQPGDIAQFSGITNTTANLTSRFIQKDNHMIGESFSLSWRSNDDWLKRLRLGSLSVTGYLNDIFRLEKVKAERGIEYPYSRTASLSINVTF